MAQQTQVTNPGLNPNIRLPQEINQSRPVFPKPRDSQELPATGRASVPNMPKGPLLQGVSGVQQTTAGQTVGNDGLPLMPTQNKAPFLNPVPYKAGTPKVLI